MTDQSSADLERAPTTPCRIYRLADEQINLGELGAEALAVHARLREAGHEAYLVGGCVRDLLLGHEPKDFDVATSALPSEVHAIFRRSRIVGRRFQIVHVRAGREIIEVSTFRGHHSPEFDSEPDEELPASASAIHAESGMLLRDNVFGTFEEDALRRDFTVNGLYYDPEQHVVLDFSTGVEDLERRVLRVIGEPIKRFQEDPVRMLRAIRFAAKLGFEIEASALDAIRTCGKLLSGVAAARMFEEILKLLISGRGLKTFMLLEEHGLFAMLFPQSCKAFPRHGKTRDLIVEALRNTDERVAVDKPVTPAFLFAAMLWPALVDELARSNESHLPQPTSITLQNAEQDVIRRQNLVSTIPRRFATPMREIWELQFRLIGRRQPQRLATHPRFRAAYDFVLLREQAGESLGGAGEWWTRFQAGDTAALPAPAPASTPRRRRRRGRRSSRATPE